MGQQESTYRKFDDKARRRRRREEVKKNVEEVGETQEKVRPGGHFSLKSLKWRPSLVIGSLQTADKSDLSSSPGWYHGWCNKTQVEKILSAGPDGLFLVKNSTEFAGDMTLCISHSHSVLFYRIRQLQDTNKFTVDNDHSFDELEDLIDYYKHQAGSLPCKLSLAAGREVKAETNDSRGPGDTDKKAHSKYSAKRRKRNIDMEEILIVNREL